MELRGEVTKGIGTAKMWVGKIENVFNQKTGMKVFHGTLNIVLNEPYLVQPDLIIKPEEFGGTQNVFVKTCNLLGEEAFIVRAEKNQIGQGEHNLKILEIVSNINFREKYKLKDGDSIIINLK